ncbi:MAG: lipopolysaccharide assembly protein LapA domain-containing protein [Steroidobacteraceae bacterium]
MFRAAQRVFQQTQDERINVFPPNTDLWRGASHPRIVADMRVLFSISFIVAAFLALLVTALNPGPVALELAVVQFSAPLGFALVLVFVLGLLAGMLWRVRWVAELLGERGRLRRALRLAESRARENAVVSEERSEQSA